MGFVNFRVTEWLGVHISLFARFAKQHKESGKPHPGNYVHALRKPVTQRKNQIKATSKLWEYQHRKFLARSEKKIECLIEGPLVECGKTQIVHAS